MDRRQQDRDLAISGNLFRNVLRMTSREGWGNWGGEQRSVAQLRYDMSRRDHKCCAGDGVGGVFAAGRNRRTPPSEFGVFGHDHSDARLLPNVRGCASPSREQDGRPRKGRARQVPIEISVCWKPQDFKFFRQ